jgi:hypothetical protein
VRPSRPVNLNVSPLLRGKEGPYSVATVVKTFKSSSAPTIAVLHNIFRARALRLIVVARNPSINSCLLKSWYARPAVARSRMQVEFLRIRLSHSVINELGRSR